MQDQMQDRKPRSKDPRDDLAKRVAKDPRDDLAKWVVIGAFVTIFLLIVMVVVVARFPGASSAVADKSFNAVLPVLAAWVGSVLAFYFAQRSQDATNQTLQQAQRALSDARGGSSDGIPIEQKMIPIASVRSLIDLANPPGDGLELAKLRDLFKGPTAVTRLLFVQAGSFRYLMHISTFHAFLVSKEGGSQGTLKDIFSDEEAARQMKLVVHLPPSSTLGQAKAALDGVTGAQDVIVTDTGKDTGKVVGWLTNVDLLKALNPK